MKDKSCGTILQYNEALNITTDYNLKVYGPSFSTGGGIFDGYVHIWEFVKLDEKGVIKEWHYFYTDAYNIFNF